MHGVSTTGAARTRPAITRRPATRVAAPRVAALCAALLCAAAVLGGLFAAAARAATVSAPKVTSTVAKSATFRVAWSDATLPVGPFHVDYQEAGGDHWLHWQIATALTAANFPGQQGRTYRFRVALDDAGVPGEWSPEALATVPFDQKAFTFSSGWTAASSSTAFAGSTKYASRKGRWATYAFTGDSLTLVAPKGPAKGKVTVYVREKAGDAWGAYVKVKTLDLYARSDAARRSFALKTWDTVAERQAKFVVTGTKNRRSKGTRVDLDGLAVRNDPVPVAAVRATISPAAPSVYTRETCQFTATVAGTPLQDVVWRVWREDRFGNTYDDDCGTITADGLWTAPATPTITYYDTSDLSLVRSYRVSATPVADPSLETVGLTTPVVSIRPPIITSVTPDSAPEGGTITVTGQYFGTDPSQFELVFDGRPGVVTSLSDTTATATVYDQWGGWRHTQPCYVFVRREGVPSYGSLPFTVTDIKCDPPEVRSVNWNRWAGCVGDVLEIYGYGFDRDVDHNLVRFNDVVTTPTAYWDDPYDGSGEKGYLSVVVPQGATTGPLQIRRSDGNGLWSTEPSIHTFEVRPPLDLQITGLADGGGIVDLDCHDAAAGSASIADFMYESADNWVIAGKGFMSLSSYINADAPGSFAMDVTVGAQTWTMEVFAYSDTRAVAKFDSFEFTDPEEFYAAVRKGDSFTARLRGIEWGTWYERTSEPVTIPVSDGMMLGRAHSINFIAFPGDFTVAEDDIVQVTTFDDIGTHQLSAPGLWSGTLPFGGSGINGKVVVCDTPGTYTITDHTAGTTSHLIVDEIGPSASAGVTSASLAQLGVTLAFGNARLEIPAGALPPVTEADPAATAYNVIAQHEVGTHTYADPVASDFGHRFKVVFTPEPPRLLKPVTLTVPYSPAGRTSPPVFGLIDDDTGLYYALDAVVDESEHTMTVTFPAGDYSGGSSPAPAANDAPDGRGTKTFVMPPGGGLNRMLTSNGVLSYNKVVGYLTDETRHLEVTWTRDSGSSSYVSDAVATEVFTTAQAAYDRLVSGNWAAPSGWLGDYVTIHIRDLGEDPGGTNGGMTTKSYFGQPWVFINSQCTSGPRIQTAVAHEMCHAFQRQYTTNVVLQWIDEATAEWCAVHTLPGTADLEKSITGGCDFASVGIPDDFDSGFDDAQGYAAGAFIIYLANEYGSINVSRIYDRLYWSPTWWDAGWATLEDAFGQTMEDMVMGFGQAYWKQEYFPLTGSSYSISPLADSLQIQDWGGRAISEQRPPMSSERYTVSALPAFESQIAGQDTVVRVDALGPSQRVYVYGDTGFVNVRPDYAALTELTFLYSDRLSAAIGPFNGSGYRCYRIVVINASRTAATPVVRIVTPHIASTTPGAITNDGGQSLTIPGWGLGSVKGKVHIMGVECPVTSWSDTSVTVTTPNLGTYVGNPEVKVTTAEFAMTNAVTIAVLD